MKKYENKSRKRKSKQRHTHTFNKYRLVNGVPVLACGCGESNPIPVTGELNEDTGVVTFYAQQER